jgi:peroxiredoxin
MLIIKNNILNSKPLVVNRKFHTLIRRCLNLIFTLTCFNASAQYTVISDAISKLNQAGNLSYHSEYRMKDRFSDTLKIQQNVLLLKVTNDIELGYFFRNSYTYGPKKTSSVDLYNGKALLRFNLPDTSYVESSAQRQLFNESLLGELNLIKSLVEEDFPGIAKLTDTLFNNTINHHYLFKVKDTTINNDHFYNYKHVLIDKATGLPTSIFTRSRIGGYGKEVINRYTEQVYSAYNFNIPVLTEADFDIPAGYRNNSRPHDKVSLLKPGNIAPDWTLIDINNKKMSLSQLKGFVVLLDFFYVGCIPCMDALPSLQNLQKKYNNNKFVILSVSLRDEQKVLKAFGKSQQIHHKLYPDGKGVAKLYHVIAAPTYYLIDKSGFISNNWEGNPVNFESKLSALIDDLLK